MHQSASHDCSTIVHVQHWIHSDSLPFKNNYVTSRSHRPSELCQRITRSNLPNKHGLQHVRHLEHYSPGQAPRPGGSRPSDGSEPGARDGANVPPAVLAAPAAAHEVRTSRGRTGGQLNGLDVVDVGLGRIISLCTTAQPRYARFTKRVGASILLERQRGRARDLDDRDDEAELVGEGAALVAWPWAVKSLSAHLH